MRTRNVTLAISIEAHHRARLWAAQHDVSLSAVVSALLEHLPTNPNAARAAHSVRRPQPQIQPVASPAPPSGANL